MKNIQATLQALKIKQEDRNLIFKPQFFRLSNSEDREQFELLLQTPELILTDELESQIKELIKIKNPGKKLSLKDFETEAQKIFGTTGKNEFGLWIYYPWSKRLVHSLDENEFVELRTSRNKYKITEEEQQTLLTKKVLKDILKKD
jgi:hypothetical protein